MVYFTGAGNNTVQLYLAAFASKSGSAAFDSADGFTQGPGDEVSSVEGSGFLPGQPFNGMASNIESKYVVVAIVVTIIGTIIETIVRIKVVTGIYIHKLISTM